MVDYIKSEKIKIEGEKYTGYFEGKKFGYMGSSGSCEYSSNEYQIYWDFMGKITSVELDREYIFSFKSKDYDEPELWGLNNPLKYLIKGDKRFIDQKKVIDNYFKNIVKRIQKLNTNEIIPYVGGLDSINLEELVKEGLATEKGGQIKLKL